MIWWWYLKLTLLIKEASRLQFNCFWKIKLSFFQTRNGHPGTLYVCVFIEQAPAYRKGRCHCWMTCLMKAVDASAWLEFSGTSRTGPRPGPAGTCPRRRGPLRWSQRGSTWPWPRWCCGPGSTSVTETQISWSRSSSACFHIGSLVYLTGQVFYLLSRETGRSEYDYILLWCILVIWL